MPNLTTSSAIDTFMQAANQAAARAALGLGTIATQAASAVSITGGTIAGITSLGVAGGTVTANSPIFDGTQTWNAGGVVFTGHKQNITATALAADSKLFDWQVNGTSQLSLAYNTTASPFDGAWRLVFGSSASIGYVAGNGAIALRNAANTSHVNFSAGLIQAYTGVIGTNYIAIGTNSEGDVELSSTVWRGAGLRLRDTGSVVWTSSSAASGTDRNFIRSGSGSPESVVTANVGSMWLRTDGGASTTLYIKESGTGNTGWIAK